MWNADTVKVVGSVTVEDGVTLTILPGVKVEFQDYYSLTVKGRLLASGTPSERILFTTDEPDLFTPDGSHAGCWNGIRFPGTRETNGGSLLEYCILEYSKDTALKAEDPPGCGGALSAYDFSKLVIRNCIFRHNAADYGGALFLYFNASPVITGNLFHENHALENASVLYCGYSFPAFACNTAAGNPVHNLESPYIDSCAVLCFQAKPRFENDIFWENDPEVSYAHSQLWQNKAYYTTHNDIEDYGTAGPNVHEDPRFVAPPGSTNADLRLQASSPCINRGANGDGPPALDLDGTPRPTMGSMDMGAYEFAGVHRLAADGFSLSAAAGGRVAFTLSAGTAGANRAYLLLGSASGTLPGIPLPGGEAVLPLEWDLFTRTVLGALNTPFFNAFQGILDPTGNGTAALDLPPIPGLEGTTLYFAYTLQPFDFTSNPVVVEIVP